MRSNLKILDVVALLRDIPEQNLVKGQVGTIVEIWDAGVFEVEFSNTNGETLALAQINEKDLLLLHYQLKAA
ncbi:MAG: hypothetical protein JWO03_1328 [Bacteroidetes bacterium]|nr:hypothetical protein [Bacteroidota bacterium]